MDHPQQPIWSPGKARIHGSRMHQFMQLINASHRLHLADYGDLWQWSIREPATFWSALWYMAGIRASRPPHRVLSYGEQLADARWFVGAQFNYAENLLRERSERPALICRNERGQRQSISFNQLYRDVLQLAAQLKRMGVGPGDRVAGLVVNNQYPVIAMLATSWLGAIWSSCSPDFGSSGILERLLPIQPKVLFACQSYRYNGAVHPLDARLQAVVEQLPSLEQLILLPVTDQPLTPRCWTPVSHWDDLLAHPLPAPEPVQLPFDAPLAILFSSGTTGTPKCIVHGQGGTLLQHIKEHQLHCDLGVDDRLCYFTTCGWMMWNWQVSALALGTTLVLYDGAPMFPAADRLWQLISEEQVSVFGTSAAYLAATEKAGLRPGQQQDLGALKTLLSTGSPLAAEQFEYVYRAVKSDLMLASISGGTDIISCFALGCPLRPVYAGQLQCRGLGMAVAVFDAAGQPVTGERGELVCTEPFPSMPLGFWQDPDGARYQAAYFARYPGVWTQGDFAELTAEDGLIIHGRSDSTLNPGGVRIGTGEIYRQVEQLPEVLESLCIGQQWQGDERIILFVHLRPDEVLTEALEDEIRSRIRRELSPRHVPARIIPVGELPRTRSGKLVERAVRERVHGRPVDNLEAIANPEALEQFADLKALRD